MKRRKNKEIKKRQINKKRSTRRKIRRKNKFYILVFIFLLFVLLFISFLNLTNHTVKKEKLFQCNSDNDCVLQQTTCCSCNMGGNEECMSKKEAEAIEKELKQECSSNLYCIALYNCKIKSCKCVNGKCVRVK